MNVDPKKYFYKNYVLSNGGVHLFRFVNTNFGSKWAGVWNFDKKLLDYWAYKINDEWLSMHNCKDFENDYWHAKHKHVIGDINVTEDVVPAKEKIISLLKIKNNSDSEKTLNILLEVGANIRYRDENSHDYKYSVISKNNLVEVKNKIGTLCFGSSEGKFVKKEIYEDHKPGKYAGHCGYFVEPGLGGSWNEDVQSKYVPGEYFVELNIGPDEERIVPFIFSESKISKVSNYKELIEESRKEYENLKKNYVNNKYQDFFDKTLSSLMSFRVDNGFIAGYPFFNEIWVRDACWCLPAYLYLGMTDEVRNFIDFVGDKIKKGKVPSLINSKEAIYNSSDVSPLWIIGLYDYLDFTGDKKFGKSLLKKVIQVLEYGIKKMNKYVVMDDGFTWMDSIERKGAIDLQALWSRAFYCGGRILEINNKNPKKYYDTSSKMIEEINKHYWNGKVKDNVSNNFESPNFLFQLALMHTSKDVSKFLSRTMKKEYLTSVGIKSRPSSDSNYDPKGYHTGAVWPFLTLTAAMAHSNYDNVKNAKKLLDINFSNFDKNCINGINEIFYADNLKPRGCTSQAWSVAGIIPVFDGYFLGIKPKLTEDMIILNPYNFFLNKFNRRIKIGGKFVELNYSKNGDKIKLDVSGLPVKAKLPNFYKEVFLNDKKVNSKVLILEPKKKHSIRLKL